MRRSIFASLICACFAGAPAFAAEPPTACATLAKSMVASGPAFLPSYPTVTSGPLQGAAFLYDNAVATIALVAGGEVRKASHIGDAIPAALGQDRYWHDARLH